jgi:hypothetical protein
LIPDVKTPMMPQQDEQLGSPVNAPNDAKRLVK